MIMAAMLYQLGADLANAGASPALVRAVWHLADMLAD